MTLTETDAPDPVVVGDELRYTASIENRGPDTAEGVRVTITLSSGTAEVAAATQGTCSGTTTIVCELGSVAVGGTPSATVALHPSAAGTLTSTATLTASTADPDAASNTATATTTVTPSAAGS
jgi:uncharacterized repeat protein (TIGR01451 family)